MLRRIPSTPLVCLVILLSILFTNASWAAGPDESMEMLLKPSQQSGTPAPAVPKAKFRSAHKRMASAGPVWYPPGTKEIVKVKPFAAWSAYPVYYDCILPQPRVGQWDISGGVLFARIRGNVAWPRYSWWNLGIGGWDQGADLKDSLMLPGSLAVPTFSARYQFRPNWALRYSMLGFQANGGGWPQNMFAFGPWYQSFGFGTSIQSQWQHLYQRLGMSYDALKSCRSVVTVFTEWVHVDDRITAGCNTCGLYSAIFSRGTDAAIVGLEWQKCIKASFNGGTLSWDCKAGAIFLDNVEGWDVQAGARYSIPLNCGRSGYLKGGYRLVDLKKSQDDFMLKDALEGGYMEFGFIF